jgi:NADPH:quinone reductase-like Zn-dependent oxidoreductase
MPNAIQFSEYGGPEVLRLVDVAAPTPGPGEVRLATRAAGVNPIECKIRSGMMAQRRPMQLPAGLGSDIAGVVEAVGPGVSDPVVGDRVMGSSLTPAYAQVALARASDLVRKPADVEWEVAGSIGIAGRTAWRTLTELQLAPGETLLIHAAAGGVGLVAVQLAVARGVRVVGTASDANHDFLRSLGAIPIRYGDGWEKRVRAAAPGGIDAVLDGSGRGELPGSIELAGGTERIVTIAAYDAADHGVYFSGPASTVDMAPALGELTELLAAGKLQLPIWRTYPLAHAAAAHAESEAAHLRGKIVLLPS